MFSLTSDKIKLKLLFKRQFKLSITFRTSKILETNKSYRLLVTRNHHQLNEIFWHDLNWWKAFNFSKLIHKSSKEKKRAPKFQKRPDSKMCEYSEKVSKSSKRLLIFVFDKKTLNFQYSFLFRRSQNKNQTCKKLCISFAITFLYLPYILNHVCQ